VLWGGNSGNFLPLRPPSATTADFSKVSHKGSAATSSIASRRDEATTADITKRAQSPATLGHYSHGTTHFFLAAAEDGMLEMRSYI